MRSNEKAQTYLDVYHQNKTDPADDEYFTRYDLDLFSYTLLADYFTHTQNADPMTAGHLLKNINRYCSQYRITSRHFTTDLHLTLQTFWHYHYHLGPTLLKISLSPCVTLPPRSDRLRNLISWRRKISIYVTGIHDGLIN